MNGGGNLGDLWITHEEHRRRVIERNAHRRIVILPQTIYFADPKELEESARIYNNHPDLTLFVRDLQSFEIAGKYFANCKVVLAPDMAFFLLPKLRRISFRSEPRQGILFLSRDDKEKNEIFTPPGMWGGWFVEDWASRSRWRKFSSAFVRLPKPPFSFPPLPGLPCSWITRAWEFLYLSARQLLSRSFVLTDRLHGHILALMLDVPHFLLPNRYHKNESFFETWSRGVPHGCLVRDPSFIASVPRRSLFPFAGKKARAAVRSAESPKISYCTPCMGRLPHLKRTFLKNLEDNARWPNVEFVLLNYGSDPAVEDWAGKHLRRWIDSGRVRYYRTVPYPFFHMAHAKNVAHRLASGKIVCNLDADNFTGKEFTPFLWDSFAAGRRRIVHAHWKVRLQSMGRVALWKRDFIDLGGYEESFFGWGSEDVDLLLRAIAAGMERCLIPDERLLKNILHGDEERVIHFREEEKDTKKTLNENRNRMLAGLASLDYRANRDISWGRARVYPNFAQDPVDVGS
jgi:pyruvyl transferase EpsO